MTFPDSRTRRALVAAFSVVALGAGGAAASTIHRMAATQTTGSEGATAFFTSNASSSALQGEVGGTSANTSIQIPFGVLGEYDRPGGAFGIGVAGISTTGYGVGAETFGANPAMIAIGMADADAIEAYSDTGSHDAVYGEALDAGNGVVGYADNAGFGGYFSSAGGIGSEGFSTSDIGVDGYSTTGTGVFGETGNAAFAIQASEDSSGASGGLGLHSGEGVIGYGSSGNTHAAVASYAMKAGTDLYSGFSYNGGSRMQSFAVQAATLDRSGSAATYGSDVQISGDVYVTGNVYQGCDAFPATASTSCHNVTAATDATTNATSRASTVEMTGTARLVNGRASVALDPNFARTMSAAQPYHITLTPFGDSHGVYVSRRTPQGFEVAENMGGRSTLDFDYRIVAAPAARAPVARRPSAGTGDLGMSALLETSLARQRAAIARSGAAADRQHRTFRNPFDPRR